MASSIELTINAFRAQQLASSTQLFGILSFLISFTSLPAEEQLCGGVGDFLTTPLLAALSDKYGRNKMMLIYLMLFSFLRISNDLLVRFKLPTAYILNAAVQGGFFACVRASLADFSTSPVSLSKACIKISLLGALGSVLNPLAQRLGPQYLRPLVMLSGAVLYSYTGEQAPEEAEESAELNVVACSPLSFSSFNDQWPMLISSFLSEMNNLVQADLIFHASTGKMNPLRMAFLLALASVGGNAISLGLQNRFGLKAQARFATVSQTGVALAVLANEPEIALGLSLFAKRTGDVSDSELCLGESRGERAGAVANVKLLASFTSGIVHAFLVSRFGSGASASAFIATALLAEGVRLQTVKTRSRALDD